MSKAPNPYHLPEPGHPALIAFSGGRTSAFMLHQIVDAHGGKLPRHIKVAFFNTGKEMPATLDFVNEVAKRTGVKVIWLEYSTRAKHETKRVNYRTAARNGEPYAALIKAKALLPNPTMRFCTQELKVRRGRNYMHRVLGYKHWYSIVGLRYDESRRWLNHTMDTKERFTSIFPLVAAEVTKAEVSKFWKRQDYDLQLPNINGTTPLGNCDLCFLKGTRRITSIIRERPELAEWWIQQEAQTKARLRNHPKGESGAVFRMGYSYTAMKRGAESHDDLLELADDPIGDCLCTD